VIATDRRRRSKRMPADPPDPYRRLMAAVTVQALVDLLWPSQVVTPQDRLGAASFVIGEQRLLVESFNIPANKVSAALAVAEEVSAALAIADEVAL
jgi:hypothetical protein